MGSSGSKQSKKSKKDESTGGRIPKALGFVRKHDHEKIMTGAEYHRDFPGLSVKFLKGDMSHWATHGRHTWQLGLNRGTLDLKKSNGAGLYFAHHTGSETRSIEQFGTVAYRVRIPPNAWVIAEQTKGWFRANAVWLEKLSIGGCDNDNDERRMVESMMMIARDHTVYPDLQDNLKVAVITDLYVGQAKAKSMWNSTTKSKVLKKYRSRYA